MTKIRTIIIDDEPKAIDILKRYCEDVEYIDLVSTFRDPIQAVSWIQNNTIDLIFLDINMPKISGLEFLNILNQKPKVIFTTAYSEFAVNSYDYDTIDYLLKPIDLQRFLKAVTKAHQLFNNQHSLTSSNDFEINTDKIIYIKSGPQLFKLNINDILYLEKDGNYLMFHTKDKKILSRQNMKDIFEILNPKDFIRVHKSFVVAIRHMDIIESHQIKIGDAKIPVGRNFRDELNRIIGDNNV